MNGLGDTVYTNPLGAGTGATSSRIRGETLLSGASNKVKPQTTAARQKKTVAFQPPGTEQESAFVNAFAGADGSSFPGLLGAQADSTTPTTADGDAGDFAVQDDAASSVRDEDEDGHPKSAQSKPEPPQRQK
jgi:hypothetical protein